MTERTTPAIKDMPRKFRLMWKWGQAIAIIGIGLVIIWLFTSQFGSARDILAIVGNILLFTGIALGFIGFMQISKLTQEKHKTGN